MPLLGYAFVTGLAYQYVKKAQEKLNTFDVEEPPPPPPDEPPPAAARPADDAAAGGVAAADRAESESAARGDHTRCRRRRRSISRRRSPHRRRRLRRPHHRHRRAVAQGCRRKGNPAHVVPERRLSACCASCRSGGSRRRSRWTIGADGRVDGLPGDVVERQRRIWTGDVSPRAASGRFNPAKDPTRRADRIRRTCCRASCGSSKEIDRRHRHRSGQPDSGVQDHI